MEFRGALTQQQLPRPATNIYLRDERGGFLLSEDKTIYEFDSSGRVRLLAGRPEFAALDFQEALRPPEQPWLSRRLAVTKGGSHLFIADEEWSAEEGIFLKVCLIDLSGGEPLIRHIPDAHCSSHNPFFFLGGRRIGVDGGDPCVSLDAHDLTPFLRFSFITREFSPSIILNCLHPHPDGREFSVGMGDVGHGVYRRLAVSETDGRILIEIRDEVVFEGRADLWVSIPSLSGDCAFLFLMNHETSVILPGGLAAHPTADIGEVVRVWKGGRTERLTVRGELAIDFEVVKAQLWTPTQLPPDVYRVYPKGPKEDKGWQPVLCPVNDESVLYPTPGGSILEVDFSRNLVSEVTRVGFLVRALSLLSPHGPLAVIGDDGQFWLLNVEPRVHEG